MEQGTKLEQTERTSMNISQGCIGNIIGNDALTNKHIFVFLNC